MDTGILSSHQEFSGRVLSGYTAISDGNGTTDCNGHGTHVAGTVGGTTYGVAKNVNLVPIRILGCDGSVSSNVIAGLDWILKMVKPAVVNMSLGGATSSSLDSAVENLYNNGYVMVVAAGNSNTDACTSSPARVSKPLQWLRQIIPILGQAILIMEAVLIFLHRVAKLILLGLK